MVAARVKELYPDRAQTLTELWRTRQFEYTWLRTLTNTYADFRKVSEDSLVYAAQATGIELTADKKDDLLSCFWRLPAWPEAKPVLAELRRSGRRLVFLSNLTEAMLSGCIRTNGLEAVFSELLSTDRVRVFKPHPGAYRMASDVLGVSRHKVLFAAFAPWDVAGAKAFGYPTFWVNRLRSQREQLGGVADWTSETLDALTSDLPAVRKVSTAGRDERKETAWPAVDAQVSFQCPDNRRTITR